MRTVSISRVPILRLTGKPTFKTNRSTDRLDNSK
jgi:hypothetical protein